MQDRTPQQIAADDALTAALEQVVRAYDEWPDFVLTEYLVISSRVRFTSDGDSITAVVVTPRDGDVPLHRILGLIDFAQVRMRAIAAEPGDDDL